MATGGAAGRARSERPGAPQPLATLGHDVPHWLDPKTGEALTRVDPRSGLRCCLVPGVGAPPEPRSDWVPPPEKPPKSRGAPPAPEPPPQRLRLLNTLTGQSHVVEARGAPLPWALPWNAHAGGYAWRCGGGAPLRPESPLELPPLDPDDSPPTVLLYFADDFLEL